jgi:hypothetical protein
MNRACFSKNTSDRERSHEHNELKLHEQNQHAGCVRPLRNNFVPMKKIVTGLLVLLMAGANIFSQQAENEASLILDLKKARASFEMSRQKYENNKKLIDNKAISEDEFTKSKNELLSTEVDYQKLILRLISQQSYIVIEKAIKYQNSNGDRKVKITLRSTMEGNQEFLNQFKEHFDIFTPEMRSNKVYNIFVSLVNIPDKTIIGTPYEVHIPVIELGTSANADFTLLKDLESVEVNLTYSGKIDKKNIYLQKDASTNIVDISSSQFSQETNLGAQASYGLTLERFSSSDDIYQLLAVNLPKQINAEFTDSENSARLSQLKFNQGVNIRKLALKTYLPERDDEDVVIDKPISFYALAVTKEVYDKLGDIHREFSSSELNNIPGGKIKLELIPRGVGRIEVRAPNLYHEIKTGDSVTMKATIYNSGTRRLDNVKIICDNPLNWHSIIKPDLIKSLDPGKEQTVTISILPPGDVSVGAQEIKIKTEAYANNTRVESDDKTVRIQIEAKTPILGTIFLILLLIGIIVGIVIFGIKISKR